MKQLTMLASALTFLITASASAEIRELGKMKDALSDIQDGDVVVFDIDNTILRPAQTLGSDQWVDQMIERHKQEGLEIDKAVEVTLKDWEQVQRATEVRLIEKQTPRLIRKLQMRGIVTLALTARPDQLREVTEAQLASRGVYFHHYGVHFANGKNKGLLLKEFMASINLKPRRLIFIDDKVKNVKNVDEAFVNAEFPNTNYRYAAADAWVRTFSWAIADAQWFQFVNYGRLPSDEQTRDLLDTLDLAQ